MLPPITQKYDDHSTDTYFQFGFHCDECGAVWKSEQYPFSFLNMQAANEGEQRAREIMWKAEHDEAYERANTEAIFRFSKCPVCGKRVCENCFSEFECICLKCQNGIGGDT